MSEAEITEVVRDYLEREVVDSPGVSLEPDTALLELGILSSLSTMQLTSFIRRRFGIEIPPEEMVGRNFRDLNSISALVASLRKENDGQV